MALYATELDGALIASIFCDVCGDLLADDARAAITFSRRGTGKAALMVCPRAECQQAARALPNVRLVPLPGYLVALADNLRPRPRLPDDDEPGGDIPTAADLADLLERLQEMTRQPGLPEGLSVVDALRGGYITDSHIYAMWR